MAIVWTCNMLRNKMQENKSLGSHYLIISLIAVTLYACGSGGGNGKSLKNEKVQASPYPLPITITGVSFDFANTINLAQGSDLWPTTWADDDLIYAGWGDGGGFNGTNTIGRVSLGFASISGLPPNIKGTSVWGATGTNCSGAQCAPHPATFCGKPAGMISVAGKLYAWVGSFYGQTSGNFYTCISPDPTPYEYRLATSTNHSATWTQSSWHQTGNNGTIILNGFVNYGKDVANPDGYIYMTGFKQGDTAGNAYLARVTPANINNDMTQSNQTSYFYYAGLDSSENPTWSNNPARAVPISTILGQGVGIQYDAPLRKYLLIGTHGDFLGQFELYDSSNVYGPWHLIDYEDNWGGYQSSGGTNGSISNFPPKWISADGKTLWIAYSANDTFSLTKATLTLK